ncbi:MAG: 1,4-dihydroxy-6-naphthoate synthase [Desulfohalobiaceae bacterium]|nr:1,4-dihydroxy-6-naphthoate synthase [Desulfohalobiaceae bacterium]
MSKPLRLGISPCPNDTYIFYGLLEKIIGLEGFDLNTTLLDIQELNQAALRQEYDLIKISLAACPRIRENYRLLRAGAALGRGCGPLLVAREKTGLDRLRLARVAIPGRMTTANLLLRKHGFHQGQTLEMRYDLIMEAVCSGRAEAGLIIHEGRFTYPEYGLTKVLDLGQWWEEETGLPIPLGAIVARRELGPGFAGLAEEGIRKSLDFSAKHFAQAWPFIREQAQEMDQNTIRQHIQTFVTEFSHDLGDNGLRAIEGLLGIPSADLL